MQSDSGVGAAGIHVTSVQQSQQLVDAVAPENSVSQRKLQQIPAEDNTPVFSDLQQKQLYQVCDLLLLLALYSA